MSKRFRVFSYFVDIFFPKIEFRKIYKPSIYTFTHEGKWYWDFGRSFDNDAKLISYRKDIYKKHELFGPFDNESEACADWLKGCQAHQYQIPWPVVHMGEVEDNTTNWRSIYGSWKIGIGHLD